MVLKRGEYQRLKEILKVFADKGFYFLASKISLKYKLKLPFYKKKPFGPKELRECLEELGPTFIKMGQMLSLRPDYLPQEYVEELSKLQDDCPPFSWNQAKKIIEEELNRPIEAVFQSVEKKPVSAASLSQVHVGYLKKKNNSKGKKVAIKIQRPKVKKIVEEDMHLILFLAHLLDKHSKEARKYKALGIAKEFADWAEKEIDFTYEARNADIFRKNFSQSKNIEFPKIYWEYITPKIIVMDFLEGTELRRLIEVRQKQTKEITEQTKKKEFEVGGYKLDEKETEKIADLIVKAYLKQVFEDGFFHADPHPANILFKVEKSRAGKQKGKTKKKKRDERKKVSISFLDLGITGEFNPELREKLFKLLMATIQNDPEIITDELMEMGTDQEDINQLDLKEEVTEIMDEFFNRPIKLVKGSRTFYKIIRTSARYGIRLPADLVLFARSVMVIEGTALELDPDYNFFDHIKPYLKKLTAKKLTVGRVKKAVLKNAEEYKEMIEELPKRTKHLLDLLEKGKIDIRFVYKELESFEAGLDRAFVNLALGILIAALVVGGSLALEAPLPKINGITFISFICFGLAAIISLWFFIRISRGIKRLFFWR